MSIVVDIVLPVFGIIAVGWLAGRARLLGAEASLTLHRFVYWIALPPLLFLAMARAPVAEVLHLPFIGAFLGGVLGVWGVAMLIGRLRGTRSLADRTLQGMNAGFANTGYMGIPLFVAAFGEAQGLPPATLATVCLSVVCIALAVIGLELSEDTAGGGRRHGWRHALADVARALAVNPLVVAPIAGVAWSLIGWPVPAPMANLFSILGAAAGPAALLAVGLFLAERRLTVDIGAVGWICVLKLFLQPLITAFLAIFIFPMTPFLTASVIILSALPTGALTFVMAQKYHVYIRETSEIILLTTVFSSVTIAGLLAYYGPRLGLS